MNTTGVKVLQYLILNMVLVQLKIHYINIYMFVYNVYYGSVDYQPGQSSDLIISIFYMIVDKIN